MRVYSYSGIPDAFAVGDLVYFKEEKRPYRVRAFNNRYVICTKPFNPRHTVQYTILDLLYSIRGPDDLVFGFGYETSEQIADNLRRLALGEMGISRRSGRSIPIHIEKVMR